MADGAKRHLPMPSHVHIVWSANHAIITPAILLYHILRLIYTLWNKNCFVKKSDNLGQIVRLSIISGLRFFDKTLYLLFFSLLRLVNPMISEKIPAHNHIVPIAVFFKKNHNSEIRIHIIAKIKFPVLLIIVSPLDNSRFFRSISFSDKHELVSQIFYSICST